MPCFGCICHGCANNAEGTLLQPGECENPCLNCDSCSEYVGYFKKLPGGGISRYMGRRECLEYKISEYAARVRREKIREVKR
jgi:hypothetical protein